MTHTTCLSDDGPPDDRPQAPDYAIQIQGLTKYYSSASAVPERKPALDGVDLKIPVGSLHGLLGPNGAGKSTLINILGGLTRKTAGQVKIWGRDIDTDPRNARACLGVVPQELVQDAFFTPKEILENIAGYYGVPKKDRRTLELLERVKLADKADAMFRSLSGGMKRRLMVAKAMVHAPPILILDEPSAGVDVELRFQLWKLVEELHASGVTIILTTHYLEEAESLCENITIINHGKVIADQPKLDLMRRLDHKVLTVDLTSPIHEVPKDLADLGFRLTSSNILEMQYRPSQADFRSVLACLHQSTLPIADLSTSESDLEDVFLQMTASKRPLANDQ